MPTYYVDIESNEPLSDYDLHERYDEMLDECYETAKVGPYEYPVSDALRNVDPIAYRVGFSEWLDSELEETIQELVN